MTTKRTINELAVFGGQPLFEAWFHVGRPNIPDREALLARIERMLDSAWLTNYGPLVQEFEGRLATYLGVKHCVAVTNGTIGLEILCRALGLRGEVILPSFTFVATAHALQWLGIQPVFCDVDPLTHNLDPCKVEQLVGPNTSAILGVHVWGRACADTALADICGRQDLQLIYDAAHAFGCSHSERMIGNFGAAEVFSFHATKFFNSFEGGAITTNDDELAARLRLMNNFGFAGYDQVIALGTNGKMSEVAAAMGLSSLEALDHFLCTNEQNYRSYRQGLSGLTGLQMIEYDEQEQNNYQYIVLEMDPNHVSLDRDRLLGLLHAERVLARRYFYPGCHRMEPYLSQRTARPESLSHTEELCERVLQLPTGTGVGPSEIERICSLIRFALDHGEQISARLNRKESNDG